MKLKKLAAPPNPKLYYRVILCCFFTKYDIRRLSLRLKTDVSKTPWNFQNFKSMQCRRLWVVRLQFTKKNSIQSSSKGFSEIFKTPLTNLITCRLLKIFRGATFWNIPMHMINFRQQSVESCKK